MRLARGFLYIVAFLTFLGGRRLHCIAAVARETFRASPSFRRTTFAAQEPLKVNAYRDADHVVFARPRSSKATRRAGNLPTPRRSAASCQRLPSRERYTAAFRGLFHPSDQLSRPKNHWNAPLDDQPLAGWAHGCSSRAWQARSTKPSEIWTPRYRQATFGAFLTDEPTRRPGARCRLSRRRSWPLTNFSHRMQPRHAPIVLAGHSQGAVHLLRLLREPDRGHPARSSGSPWSMPSAGRFRSSTTCPRSASRLQRHRTRPAA